MEVKQQISQVLEDINKISKKEGKEIQEIRAGNIQISRNQLSLQELLLKGTHTEEFSKAIEYYDRILEIDPNNVSAWYNKGGALYSLEKNEAIECIDKALEIKPDLAEA